MEESKRQIVLLSLIESMKDKGSWCGETHIQKTLYFLQNMLEIPTGYEYVLYKHGPFSFELREALGDLRGSMLVDVISRFPYGPSYQVSKTGKAFLGRYPKASQLYREEIDFIVHRFSELGVAELERLATALYVVEEEGGIGKDNQALIIHKLKPHIPIDVAEKAIDEIDMLKSASEMIQVTPSPV